MAEKTLFFDTNALITLNKLAFKEKFYISRVTLNELESIKGNRNKDLDVRKKAQQVSRLLRDNPDNYTVLYTWDYEGTLHFLPSNPDADIIRCAYSIKDEIVLVTDDISMYNLATQVGIECVTTENLHLVENIDVYKGYKTIHLTDAQMADFYQRLGDNRYGCKENEYLLVCNRKKEVVDIRVWRQGEYRAIDSNPIKSDVLGNVKARNPYQRMAVDMLKDSQSRVKVLTGNYGTGKTYLQSAWSAHELQKGHFDRMVYIRNNVTVKDSKEIGFLPGDMNDKMWPYLMELADTFGGEEALHEMMDAHMLEIQPLAFIRGRTYNNSIVFVSEAENLTKELIQLIIGRIGENSILVINGDYRQADSSVFQTNSGLAAMVEKFAGDPRFAYVRLEGVERSDVAAMADLLD